ncbi:ferritin-like domain-containing protein [Actinospica sp. MGRD01-02]|uniref:Ferritin-like domain-containing protein n=1 Tax=Actinospica acidithermotolerans TaxID=2828514 RepID=A0A941E8B9_9ACTN|nr:ferritin-like domain-containing protein [Actinospica acidithermotolerans]MBR7826926.1 ferritin-like domain-containing protein [Actinospica acidithermotolerans]
MIIDVGDRTFDELDPVWLLNQYRAAEVDGAGAIMRMSRLADEHRLRVDLAKHLRDESVHAWLWTKALNDIDGEIVEVDEPYQKRLAFHFGLPRTLDDLLALTWVSESRGVEQYTQHMDIKDIPVSIRQILRAILKDETWHVSYIREELERRMRTDDALRATLDRALAADAMAVADIGFAGAASLDDRQLKTVNA